MAKDRDRSAAAGAAPPAALVAALRALLRPLVRLLLGHRITYPFLAQLLKGVYVEVAASDFGLPGRAPTASRLSLLTGIHRKEVKRLREAATRGGGAPPVVWLGAQLLERWSGRAEFADEAGRPLPLPRLAPAAGGPSFESLVTQVSRDIRPRVVLDEWLRVGVVRIDARDRVRLAPEALAVGPGFDRRARSLGRSVGDHVAAAAHNLTGGSPPLLERSVSRDGLAPGSLAELAALCERLGTEALRAVGRRARQLQQRDAGKPSATGRMAFGAYLLWGDVPCDSRF